MIITATGSAKTAALISAAENRLRHLYETASIMSEQIKNKSVAAKKINTA